ncbi:MAG: hypothetical protein U1C57_02295 [Candidatus Doudnabacteria bacterium]|nr:hypothetical protein [bacterium]MDZ4243911.1 hypothetical protein [Candidatus Doudnabacteria bacterium]
MKMLTANRRDLKTKVGQIFLTHQKDKNFTSIYEEALSKQGQTLELFAVIDIGDTIADLNRAERSDYEKFAQNLIVAFKKAYIQAVQIDQNSFEKALATANSAVARFAQKNKAHWYNKLNAVVAALYKNQFSLSATGNAQGYLNRGKELSLLSEGLAENPARLIKIFSNYSSGRLANRDRVIISTNQLFNYLSLPRLREFLAEDTLEETCQEIISAVKDIKTTGFAAFIFDVLSPSGQAASASLAAAEAVYVPGGGTRQKTAEVIMSVLLAVLKYIWQIAKMAGTFVFNLVRRGRYTSRGQKKLLFAVIGIVAALLLGSIIYGYAKKNSAKKQVEATSAIAQIEEKLNEAEATLIYNDENRIAELLAEIEKFLPQVKNQSDRQKLSDRWTALKNKVSKQVIIDNPTVLTQFPNVPGELIHSPGGFVGLNRSSGTLAFYDFTSGETRQILQNESPGNIIAGAYIGGDLGFVLLTRDGSFATLNTRDNTITRLAPPSLESTVAGGVAMLATLGDGQLARIYALDKTSGQIWRLRVGDSNIDRGEGWLKTADPALSQSVGMAVDGNIYVQYPDATERYFNGLKQVAFKLGVIIPPLRKAGKIYTAANYQFLYVLDSENKRILLFDKQGGLQQQLVSEKFRDLSDIYVDEPNKIIYALSGSELLQISLK